MLRKHRTSPKLFSDCNTLQFASVMGLVVFVVLLFFMTISPGHHGVSVDLPKVLHPVAMRGAAREDAMKVTIARDGKVYFGPEQTNVADLSAKIREHLKDREVERKVYVVADTRASGAELGWRWMGCVPPGLSELHFSPIEARRRHSSVRTTARAAKLFGQWPVAE